MEKKLETDQFLKLLRTKHRVIIFTDHAIQKARLRRIIGDNDAEVKEFRTDLDNESPIIVVEQKSENPDERKFKVYYKSKNKGFMVYILSINAYIRLITTYLTSRSLQKKIYKYRKRGV
jgi:hypothetical protein